MVLPAHRPPSGGNPISAGEIKVNWPKRQCGNHQDGTALRKLIADHMVKSKQTPAHVTTFAEADVTNLVNFREKNKGGRFQKENGFKLTFTPFIIEATISGPARISADGTVRLDW